MWKRVIDSQAEKLKELDKEIRPFRQSWEEAGSMKSSVESLQNRVTELESVDKSAGQAARNTGEGGRAEPCGSARPRAGGAWPGPRAPGQSCGRLREVSEAPSSLGRCSWWRLLGQLASCRDARSRGPNAPLRAVRPAWQSGCGAACGSGCSSPAREGLGDRR